MAHADPIPATCAMPWGGPGGLVPGGWALKRTQPEKREDTVRTRLLAALFESQFVGTELAAWCAPIPGGPVSLTLAQWAGALVAQRCLFLEAADRGYQLDGPAVLALVHELALEQQLAPTVKVGTLKDTWDDHEPHGQIAVIYEFRDFDPIGFVRAPRLSSRALPLSPPAIPDAWKQRDPALLELTYPTEDPRRARLLRWLPGFFDDGTILPPLEPDLAAAFERLGVTRPVDARADNDALARAARNALGSSDGTIARLAEEQAPGVQSGPAAAEAARDLNGSTSTAPPAAADAIHGASAAPGGSTPARDLRRAGDQSPASITPGKLENARPEEPAASGDQTGARPGGLPDPAPTDAPATAATESAGRLPGPLRFNDNSGREAASDPEPVLKDSTPASSAAAPGAGSTAQPPGSPVEQAYPSGAPAGFVRGSRWRVTGVDGRDGEVIYPPAWVPFDAKRPEDGRWRVLLKFVPSATGHEGAYEQFVDVDKLAPPPRRRGQAVQTPGLFGQAEPVAKTRPSRRKA